MDEPPEYDGADLSGARFRQTTLAGSRWQRVDFAGADFRDPNFYQVRMRGAYLVEMDIDADLKQVIVNGVDIAPLVEAERDRRDPDRPAMLRPADAEGYCAAWMLHEQRWAETVAHARRLGPSAWEASVDGEWSFVQTLRHLVYATDAWLRRAVLGDPQPWDRLSLPFDELELEPGEPFERAARPSLEEVLALRADRQAGVRAFLAQLTDERLAGRTTPVDAPGWPPSESFPVAKCLGIIFNEEYEHRRFAERDLAVLEAGG